MITIIHVACIELNTETGMGRIACKWRDSLESNGYKFIHIGSKEVKQKIHPNLWGLKARQYIKRLKVVKPVLLIHEPHGGFFVNYPKKKLIIFSHGVEERAWSINKKYGFNILSLKAKFLVPWLRFFQNNKGLKRADLVLISNKTDYEYLATKGVAKEKMFIFFNGYNSLASIEPKQEIVFLFNATWIPRKGIKLIIESFNYILEKYSQVFLTLIGTSIKESNVLQSFSMNCQKKIKVVPNFLQEDEASFYASSGIFIMPSYFEGQSVALMQALAMGLCVITSDNCGQKDIIVDKKNGILFETGSADSFIDKIEWVINNIEKAKIIGHQAKKQFNEYTWQKVTNDIVRCINLTVNKN